MEVIFWLNGQFVNDDVRDGLLPANAAGTLLGLGVFTSIGVWTGRAFALDRHLARLRHDAATLELECAYSDETISGALEHLIHAHNITRGIARITLSARGDGRWNNETSCDLSILAQSTVEIDRTLQLGWSPFRIEARRATAGIKSTSYADFWLAWRAAQKSGMDDAILCNSAGALCETARANLLWTRGEELFTPSLNCGCLPGIARDLVLEWARDAGFAVREATFAPSELEAADAIFLSSAATGVRRAVLATDFENNNAENQNTAPNAVIEHLARRWNDAVSVA